MGSNSCRRLSLLSFAHLIVGSPFQVHVQCRWLTRIWDRIWDEKWTWLVLFCFCLVLYLSITKTCTPFWYQRDYDYSLSHICVYCELNMQKWVSIYETCECDIGAPDIHMFSQVDGLSTGPSGFWVSRLGIKA